MYNFQRNFSLCVYEAVPYKPSKAGIVIGGTLMNILLLQLHKGQWRGALMFTLICARIYINGGVNSCESGDLRLNRAHHDVIVMLALFSASTRQSPIAWTNKGQGYCPATRFLWVVVICPIIKCLTVLEFSFILYDLCLFITIFNFILNYVPIVTFWIFNYHKIWILWIIFCFIWNYWIIYFF